MAFGKYLSERSSRFWSVTYSIYLVLIVMSRSQGRGALNHWRNLSLWCQPVRPPDLKGAMHVMSDGHVASWVSPFATGVQAFGACFGWWVHPVWYSHYVGRKREEEGDIHICQPSTADAMQPLHSAKCLEASATKPQSKQCQPA